MMEIRRRALTVTLGFVSAAAIVGVAQTPGGAAQPPGSAKGTLTVGSARFALAHVYAVPDRPSTDPAKASHRILVTDHVLTAAEMRLARTAGSNDDDRQTLAVELADRKVNGIEAVVGPDRRLTRTNVYSPDSAMGLMVLEPPQFDAATFDAQRIAGRLFTPKTVQDARIRKPIQFDVTISAPIDRATGK